MRWGLAATVSPGCQGCPQGVPPQQDKGHTAQEPRDFGGVLVLSATPVQWRKPTEHLGGGGSVGAPHPSTPCPSRVALMLTGWDMLGHGDDGARVKFSWSETRLPAVHSPPPPPRGQPVASVAPRGVGVPPPSAVGVGEVKGGGCHRRSRKTEDGGTPGQGGGSVPVGTRLPSGSLWMSLRPWVAVPSLRWLRRWQHPPLLWEGSGDAPSSRGWGLMVPPSPASTDTPG